MDHSHPPAHPDLPLLGLGLPTSGAWATPATVLATARRAEELGYAALWTFQRVLQPAPREPADAGGGALDPSSRPAGDPAYASVHDAVLPLAFVAGHTSRIGLGTATLCAPFTPPALLAKAFTTLDHLSGGRVTCGLGSGWMPEEYAAAGVAFARRGARMDEYLTCLRALWTQDPVEFAGEFYTVPRARTGPRPVQRPHPPVLLGGAAPAALRRAGRLAEGWIASSGQPLDTVAACVDEVRRGADEAGRDPSGLRVLQRVVVDLVDTDPGPGRRPFHGTRAQVLDDLAVARREGVTEALVDLNFSPRVVGPDVDAGAAGEEARRVLDALAPASW